MRRAYRIAFEIAMVVLGLYQLWHGEWAVSAMAFGMAALVTLGKDPT